jgi:hypothetical protein
MAIDIGAIAAVTGLAAVILTPLATVLVARWQNRTTFDVTRQQIAATIVSASRREWISELRNALAAFQAATNELLYQRTLGETSKWQDHPSFQPANELRFKIALLINPNEDDHRRLLALVDERMNLLAVQPSSELLKASQLVGAQITDVAQHILKREWERVKEGESSSSAIVAARK